MQTDPKILRKVASLKSMAATMLDFATQLEQSLVGEGSPASARKGLTVVSINKALARRNQNIMKKLHRKSQ